MKIRKTTVRNLNVREEPSLSARIVDVIVGKKELEAEPHGDGSWYRLADGGYVKDGDKKERFVLPVQELDDEPVQEPDSEPMPPIGSPAPPENAAAGRTGRKGKG
jgi:hypothetical protein